VVDPCYPERYQHQARQNVHEALAVQVHNGHVLDQTVWNYHFEEASAVLTPGGRERLNYMARRRPIADPMVYVQTAHDIRFTKAEELPAARSKLDMDRIESVRTYLRAYTSGGNSPEFDVQVHNPPEVGIAGQAAEPSLRQMYSTPRATLPGQGGSDSGGGGASSGGASSGGGR
jgi:uncharacterized membrane protein YgcG